GDRSGSFQVALAELSALERTDPSGPAYGAPAATCEDDDYLKEAPAAAGAEPPVERPTKAAPVSVPPAGKAWLFIRRGEGAGQNLELEGDQIFLGLILGRDAGSQIVINDPEASRHHARIDKVNDTYFITDLDSRLGTRVNEEVIGPRVELRNNDCIQIGDSEC